RILRHGTEHDTFFGHWVSGPTRFGNERVHQPIPFGPPCVLDIVPDAITGVRANLGRALGHSDLVHSPGDGDSGRSIYKPFCVIGIPAHPDRKSTRLNSSHVKISYAVFCLTKQTYT